MADWLTYPGDLTGTVEACKLHKHLLGPDRFKAWYRPIDVVYNPETNTSRVKLRSGTYTDLLNEMDSGK